MSVRPATVIPALAGLGACDLHFAYKRPVLRGASLHVGPGDVLALLGTNGAGKSTLLRIMLGLVEPTSGRVVLDGKPLASFARRALAQRLAYVPQVHAAPFPYTVRDIALMGRLPATGMARSPGASDLSAVEAVLERMGIVHLADRPYTEVSGGERQLTLISRALVQGARVLVMDEPMNGLDYGHQIRLLERLRALAAEGYAILMTTHHPEHALLAATRVALLIDGQVRTEGRAADVVTARSIKELYGVDVTAFHSAYGHTAFYPERSPRIA